MFTQGSYAKPQSLPQSLYILLRHLIARHFYLPTLERCFRVLVVFSSKYILIVNPLKHDKHCFSVLITEESVSDLTKAASALAILLWFSVCSIHAELRGPQRDTSNLFSLKSGSPLGISLLTRCRLSISKTNQGIHSFPGQSAAVLLPLPLKSVSVSLTKTLLVFTSSMLLFLQTLRNLETFSK